jgi:hypothetical protein
MSAAIILALLAAAALLVAYLVAKKQERGQRPHWSREVYLYFNPGAPAPDIAGLTASLGASLAAPAQVETYYAAGGSAHGYGYTAASGSSRIVGAIPTGLGLGWLTASPWPGERPPTPVGVWLYGAKPRRGTRGVTPFNCVYWFHPP